MALHVALIQPQIPPNTGNIARLCAATDTPLHLIEPLGFSLDDAEVKRAGLDYWDKVDLWVHPDWFAFRDAIDRDRCLYFSANAPNDYWEAPYRDQQRAWSSAARPKACRRGFSRSTPSAASAFRCRAPVRSLNLATAVGIVLYEAVRDSSGSRRRPAGSETPISSAAVDPGRR